MSTSAVDRHRLTAAQRRQAGRPSDVLRAFLRKPGGRLLRIKNDCLFILPAWAGRRKDLDIFELYRELSVAGGKEWADRLTTGSASPAEISNAADWLLWRRAPQGWPYV